jgi:hypothetical protein
VPGGVEDLDVAVDRVAAGVALAQPVGAVDHEAHNLVGRIGYAQHPCGLGQPQVEAGEGAVLADFLGQNLRGGEL